MIKDFNTYINEDYFSKLANRKDNGDVRKENVVTEELVRSYYHKVYKNEDISIFIKKEDGNTVVDIIGNFHLIKDAEEIPFQFGKVKGNFDCSGTKLKSLKGCPRKVFGMFSCQECDELESLEGGPQEVSYAFSCTYCNKLTSLKGAPQKVGSLFNCGKCDNLTSLEGCPEKVKEFQCNRCPKLTSLEGCPKEVTTCFSCNDCGKQFTKDYIKSLCNVKNEEYVY